MVSKSGCGVIIALVCVSSVSSSTENVRAAMSSKQIELGEIYVLSNPAMPGFLKVGFTQQSDVQERIDQLSKNTAIPLPFELVSSWLVENPKQYEKLVHARLAPYRVSQGKEFFRVDISIVDETIRKILFGDEVLNIRSELKHLISLYQKYPDRFKQQDNLVREIAGFLDGSNRKADASE